jgi:antitoxin (DNA-binding transcriptional repressor) of toxin-antitoxin stability system
MKTATISQTKNDLSALLDAVRQGETVVILDRTTPIARIDAVYGPSDAATARRINQLERRGLLQRPVKAFPSTLLSARLPRAKSSVVKALLEERKDDR